MEILKELVQGEVLAIGLWAFMALVVFGCIALVNLGDRLVKN